MMKRQESWEGEEGHRGGAVFGKGGQIGKY